MTLYEKVKTMSIEEMACFLSELYHSTDYEDDDYDPEIMEILKSQADGGAEDGKCLLDGPCPHEKGGKCTSAEECEFERVSEDGK